MRLTRPLAITLALAGALATLLGSAFGASDPPGSTADARSAVLVARSGPDAFASAPGYAAFFEQGGLRFRSAAMGESPELALRLESVRRGESMTLAAAGGTEARVEGERVSFARRGLTEVYEARAQGLEQSFVFPAPLAGTGELVVRLRLDTALVPADVHADGIVFEHAGQPVARIGAVLGIDAEGNEAQGELRLDGDRLDLVLPAAFVDAAAYPLVLDPLITPLYVVPGSGPSDELVDVSWDAETLRYCLVWNRDYGGTLAHLAHVFEQDGTPVYPMAFLGWSFDGSTAPAVCSVRVAGVFLTAHREGPFPTQRVRVTSIRATDLKMQKIVFPIGRCTELDLGGNANEHSPTAWLVWSHVDGVRSIRLQAPVESYETELATVGESQVIDADEPLNSYRRPRISQTGGETGSWLVVWEKSVSGWTYPHGCSLGWAAPGTPRRLWTSGTTGSPACDGMDGKFLVAFTEYDEGAIRGLLLSVNAAGGLDVEWTEDLDNWDDNFSESPEVARVELDGEVAYAVGWKQLDSGPGSTLRYRAFKAPDLAPYGPVQTLASHVESFRMASLRVASGLLDPALRDWFTFAVDQTDALRQTVAVP